MAEEVSVFKKVDNFVRAVANGMTFGLADRLAGVGDAVTTGGTVADNVKKQKGLSEQATAESPGLTVVGHLTGAAVTGLGVGSLVSGVPALEALSAATNVSKYGTASAVAFETGLAGPSVGVAAHTFQTVGSDMLSNLSPPPINTGEAKTAAKKER